MNADHQNAIATSDNVTKLVGLPTYSEAIQTLRAVHTILSGSQPKDQAGALIAIDALLDRIND